jgi:hypothetical protein
MISSFFNNKDSDVRNINILLGTLKPLNFRKTYANLYFLNEFIQHITKLYLNFNANPVEFKKLEILLFVLSQMPQLE